MSAVEIRTFWDQIEAGVARGLLNEAGIESMIRSDDMGGAYPNIFFEGKGYRLAVREEDVERAQEVLSVLDAGAQDSAD